MRITLDKCTSEGDIVISCIQIVYRKKQGKVWSCRSKKKKKKKKKKTYVLGTFQGFSTQNYYETMKITHVQKKKMKNCPVLLVFNNALFERWVVRKSIWSNPMVMPFEIKIKRK